MRAAKLLNVTLLRFYFALVKSERRSEGCVASERNLFRFLCIRIKPHEPPEQLVQLCALQPIHLRPLP